MCTKQEFLIISKIYSRTVCDAKELIEKMLKEDKEVRGFEHGSALTAHLKRRLEKATKGIECVVEKNEFGISRVAINERGGIKYHKKDAYRMLKAIDEINTYIL